MDYNEIENDKIHASLIRTQALQQEYEVILQQYKEASENYVNSLKNSSSNTNAQVYSALPGRTWWGTSGVAEGNVSTQEECENMCINSDNCTGATFNPVRRYCWARTGDVGVSTGKDSDYALITQQKANLVVMNELNDRLLGINDKITNELRNSSPEVQEQYETQNLKQQQLNDSYQRLLEQKMETERQLQEYYSIEEDNSNQSLYVNEQHVSLKFWVLITCIVLLIYMRVLYGAESPSISIIIWILIIIILIVLSYSLSYPIGFAMWSIIILSIILMKTGELPSP